MWYDSQSIAIMIPMPTSDDDLHVVLNALAELLLQLGAHRLEAAGQSLVLVIADPIAGCLAIVRVHQTLEGGNHFGFSA